MMNRYLLPIVLLAPLLTSVPAIAQTSYPMLMSIKPVAAQIGASSEHEVVARYSMFSAYQVLVTGEGVTGEVLTAMEEKDGKKPDMPKIKVRFTVAAEAKPGVREVRIATPQGVSTVGQLVIAADPVVTEEKNNNTPQEAQEITLPATVCGTIERNEDVDCYRFQVEAGTALTFHTRSMRLQDKIHDLQTHADPIITIRTASGTTLATADNVYAADPYLSYRFEQAGEYVLEVRDVRYQGNAYWEYSIEINDRPFVRHVHPLGLVRGQATEVQLIGDQLPTEQRVTVTPGSGRPLGPQELQLPLAGGLSNPVSVVVTDLPHLTETNAAISDSAEPQLITIPAAVSGRIETAADIDGYRFEAKKGDRVEIEVIARRLDSQLDPIVRILDAKGRSLVENDDFRVGRRSFQDARIENWMAPADGAYAIELRDLHLRGGDDFVYFLTVTRPEPHFRLFADTDKTQLTPGTCGVIFVRADRKNGFDSEINLQIEDLPPGVTATCGRILAGKGQDGCIILEAAADAPTGVAGAVISGTATHAPAEGEGIELSATAQPQQEIYMPGGGRSHWPVAEHVISVGAPSDIRSIELSTHEVVLKPGESQKIDVTIERTEGFDKNVTLDVLFQHLNSVYANPLPEGVSIDAKNSKTLLTGKTVQGSITLQAAKDAPPVEKQQIALTANVAINFVMKATYSSRQVTVTVSKP